MRWLLSVLRKARARLGGHGIVFLLLMFLSACGDGGDSGDIGTDSSPPDSAETGSAALKIKWHGAATVQGTVNTMADPPLDCEEAGVATITCKVYDESNNLLTSGDTWPCSAHSGSIDQIPVGQSRTFVILAADDEGNIVYQGHKEDINIEERPDNDVGTIAVYAFVPEGLTATTHSAAQIDLAWTQPSEDVAPAGYRIYRDGVLVGTSASTAYSDTGLTQNTQYCYTVSTYDIFGNESGPSNQDCATTGVSADEDPPTVPTGLTAQALSASQIDLAWIESSDNVGVTEYRIFRDGDQVGTSASISFSDTGLTQNTQYCYTVEAYDAAGNPSGASEQACATTIESVDWYRDSDSDHYGDPNDSVTSETQPEGYVSDDTDCDDTDAAIHPGAEEACNGIDDNCDDQVDEGVQTTYYSDADADGYGDPNNTTIACEPPTGYVTDNADCNDNDASINPGATEIADGIDNDCDSLIDEDVQTYYQDADGDGFGNPEQSIQAASQPDGYVANSGDCNDENAAINPNAAETCNEIDDNCDEQIDEGVQNTYYSDADADGYGNPNDSTLACEPPTGYFTDNADCNDNDATINPGATEIADGIDNDCDSLIDEDVQTYYQDADGDGFGNPEQSTQAMSQPEGYVTNSGDCDDENASINPNAAETCNEIDDDCDEQIDEGVQTTYYLDADADGYGDENNSTQACEPPDGYVADNTDCNDNDAAINPGATEIADGIDNDCDDLIDNVTLTYYQDADGDGFGNPEQSTQATSQPDGYVANSGDCNDENASINPNAAETCNEIDDDCDDQVDEGVQNTYYPDADGDGYGNPNDSTLACVPPDGYVADDGDCNDDDYDIYPGAQEICRDNIDNNCNDQIDENCIIDVEVNIDTDFEYVDEQWWQFGDDGQGESSALVSTIACENDLTLPPEIIPDDEDDSYILYGCLSLGNSDDNLISFVIYDYWPDDLVSLYVDLNNNEDLSDDGGPIANQLTGWTLRTFVLLDVDIINNSRESTTRPYRLWMWFIDNDNVINFRSNCYYTGAINFGSESYDAIAVEDVGDHDALYREEGLFIDLNQDDYFDWNEEHFMDGETFTVDGQEYLLHLNYP